MSKDAIISANIAFGYCKVSFKFATFSGVNCPFNLYHKNKKQATPNRILRISSEYFLRAANLQSYINILGE